MAANTADVSGVPLFVIRTIEELGLVQCHVVFTHHGGEGRVQTHSSGERDDGAVLDVAAFLAHFDRIHEHRHLVAFPMATPTTKESSPRR